MFVCAATQEGRVGVATPMKKSGAAEKSSPFPGEQDFLRERGAQNTSRMKRPAASQTQTTAGRRGLKRPAAAAGKGEALPAKGWGSEGDRRSESAANRSWTWADSHPRAFRSIPSLERECLPSLKRLSHPSLRARSCQACF